MIVLPEVTYCYRLLRFKAFFVNLFDVSGNKGCNAENAFPVQFLPVTDHNVLIGVVTLHGLGLSRLVKFLPLSATSSSILFCILLGFLLYILKLMLFFPLY